MNLNAVATLIILFVLVVGVLFLLFRGPIRATRNALRQKGQPQSRNTKSTSSPSGGAGFFSFRIMVSRGLIKLLYILGFLSITVTGFIEISRNSTSHILVGILTLTLGNLLWRILCELWIVVFSIHDILGSTEREIKKLNANISRERPVAIASNE